MLTANLLPFLNAKIAKENILHISKTCLLTKDNLLNISQENSYAIVDDVNEVTIKSKPGSIVKFSLGHNQCKDEKSNYFLLKHFRLQKKE